MATNPTLTGVLKKYGSNIEKETVEIDVSGKKSRIMVIGGDYTDNDMILVGYSKKGNILLQLTSDGVDDRELSELLSQEHRGTGQIVMIKGKEPKYTATVYISYLRNF